jgi:hypothetical protein
MEKDPKRMVGKLYNLKATIEACIRFVGSGALTPEKATEEINKIVLEMNED